MEYNICRDNVLCCDDNCQRCANLIYNKYMEQKAEVERLKKILNNMTDALVKTDEACRKAATEEITRCKDCWRAEDCDGVLYCTHFNHNVYEDDFCSNGG